MIGNAVIRNATVRQAVTRKAAVSPGGWPTPAAKEWLKARKKAQEESLARFFLLYWTQAGGGALEREVRFDAKRKWRFDFADPSARVAIELEGGVFTNGAHVRGKHFESDCEKYNAATAQGWRVFRLTRGMMGQKAVKQIIGCLTTDGHGLTRMKTGQGEDGKTGGAVEMGPMPGWQG